MRLLDHFTLMQSQILRLNAELLKPAAIARQHHIKVEIKFTPDRLPIESRTEHQPRYQLGCRMHCQGHPPEQPDEALFRTEVLLNAIYRQMQGEPVDFTTFNRLHAQLSRQLYPLLRLHSLNQMQLLGIPNVHLPEDPFNSMEEAQRTPTSQPEPEGRLH